MGEKFKRIEPVKNEKPEQKIDTDEVRKELKKILEKKAFLVI